MREKMTETKDGMSKGSWRRALSGVVAGGIVASTIAGCVESPTKTQTVDPTPTLEASPISGTGEFSVLFTPNSLQNLDAEAKAIVSKNLELINQECNQDLPGRMMPGSEKYLFSRNKSNETFIWGFCDVASADAPAKTMVSMFDWTAGPSGETTKIYKNLEYFEADGTMGYVDDNGVSHAILKINNDNMIEVYDINEKVVAHQAMTPEAIGFFDGVKNVSAEPLPTATVEATATVEVDKYEINKEKLYTMPKSYEELVANPEKFVEVHNPLVDMSAFMEDMDKVKEILGGYTELKPNLHLESTINDEEVISSVSKDEDSRALMNPYPFTFFRDGDTFYPMPIFTVVDNHNSPIGTFATILYEGYGSDGMIVLQQIAEGQKIRALALFHVENPQLPQKVNALIAVGLNAKFTDERFVIGVGVVKTIP